MVAAGIAGFAPSVIAMVVSTAVQMAAKGAAEVQVRSRANFYLNQMNEKLFKPRGLYALVMGYDPDATQAVSFGQIDMATQSIAKYDLQSNEQSRWRRFGQDMRSRSGVTNAEEDMPVCAPLVFPSVDAAAGDAEKMGRMKRVGNFLDAYFDKQGQAKYNMEHPDTALGNAVPKPKFHSAYSDPSNPARSGDALALLTAGKLQVPRRRERRGGGGLIGAAIQGVGMIAEKRAMRGSETSNAPASYGGGGFSDNASIPYRGQSRYEQDDYFSDRRNRRRERSSQLDQLGLGGLGGGRGRGRGGGGGLKGIVKKKLKSGVLYLTIVNMPSEEELQMAREMLQAQSVAG
ncbi:MAG: hypothetical protein M1820_010906 [Bogoriella megaspora]|nr:MAG: hypothetical protein M1820_010906 [Bogoriella megaspora]